MNPTVKNVLAVFAGIVIGSIVNGLLIFVSGHVIAPPEGADLSTSEGLKAAMPLMEPKHFIFPFLAHALGTLVGAYIAAKIGATHKMKLALGIGFLFLIGGIANILMLPSPIWFTAADVLLAYIPMAYIGGKWGSR